MIRSALRLLLAGLVASWVVSVHAAEPAPVAEELLLRSAGLGTDGPALLEFFRKRSQQQADSAKIQALIIQLGDDAVGRRDGARAELVSLGMASVPWLREAVRSTADRELALRAQGCLDCIVGEASIPLVVAAAELLAQRRPEGAAEALLGFLPMAENDRVMQEIVKTLQEMALRGGQPEPALLRALDDKLSLRRAVAAEVLLQLGPSMPRDRLLKMLNDPVAIVRLRVALGLARLHDQEAIGELIQLLGELPAQHACAAEEILAELAQDQAPAVAPGNDADSRKRCRDAWAAWWKRNDGDSLLAEFRKRTVSELERDHVRKLIKKLGDDAFVEREMATAALSELDIKIAPLLREALISADLEIRTRAEKCLHAIETGKERMPRLSPVTVRLAALRRPADSVAVLLDFIAGTEDEPAIDEVRAALATLAVRDGQAAPVLVKALQGKQPRRKAAAAAALVNAGATEYLPAIRRMLQDEDRSVRLETALALAGAGEKEAVPVLIALLADLPTAQGQRIDEYLRILAGGSAPTVTIGRDAAEHLECRDAWAAWWKKNEKAVTLVAIDWCSRRNFLGYTLVVLPEAGRVLEVGSDGKVRWQIDGLGNPSAAVVLAGDRVLIAERGKNRVTERSTRGDVLWEKLIDSPIGCQRLSSGNTFIVTPGNIVEVDRNGREIFSYSANGPNFLSGWKLPDGRIICTTTQSKCLLLDANRKEMRRFTIPDMNSNCLEVLSTGRLLVAQMYSDEVNEFDQEGNIVWSVKVVQPTHAFRLPNGNTLVSTQYPGKVIEFDRSGLALSEYSAPNQTRIGDVKRR